MAHQFDELAKVLAQELSRRDVLRQIGVGLGTAVLGSVGLGKAWGQGGGGLGAPCNSGSSEPCLQNGLASCARARDLCVNRVGSNQRLLESCFSQFDRCRSQVSTICARVSGCQTALTCCSGRCVDRFNDPNNCSSCGNTCGAGQVCRPAPNGGRPAFDAFCCSAGATCTNSVEQFEFCCNEKCCPGLGCVGATQVCP
jgi:hypothetical protein